MSHQAVDYRRIVVQTADTWPTSDNDWTTHPTFTVDEAEESLAPDLGGATLAEVVGMQRRPGALVIAASGPTTDLPGRYVRLLKQTEGGPVTLTVSPERTARGWTDFWWGVVLDEAPPFTSAPEGYAQHGVMRWACAGLIHDLDVQPQRGYARTGDDQIADPGEMLDFNVDGFTDRSEDGLYSVGGRPVHIHDLTQPGFAWSAEDAVGLLLAARIAEGGPPWQLSGQVEALAYTEEWSLKGLTYLQRIARILATRRGIAVRPVVRNHVPYLHVTTTVDEPITVDAATLPANEAITSLDFRNQPFLRVTRHQIDHRAVLDIIGLIGARPWSCRTFELDLDFAPDWTPAEETAWTLAAAVGREAPEVAHVFRRWRLVDPPASAWALNARTTATDASYGSAGDTGAQTATADPVALSQIRFTRQLPLYVGYDYTGGAPAEPDRTREFQKPKVFIKSNLGHYIDASDRWPIEVGERGGGILLGDTVEHAIEIKRVLASSDRIVLTLGYEDVLPLRVRWRRTPADWPRAVPRRRDYPISADWWRICADTVLQAGTTAAATTAAEVTVRDDRPAMRALLPLLRSWFENPAVSFAWEWQGMADIGDTWHPGAFIDVAAASDADTFVRSVITKRSWGLREGALVTRYTTQRILPDLRGLSA